MLRTLPLLLAVLALALFVVVPAVAADKADKAADKGDTHEGTVVKADAGKLTMTDKDGKNEHTHDVGKDAKITCDGKECKLEDLKKGDKVKVTTEKKGDKTSVVKIEASRGDKKEEKKDK
jgi:competence protein ComGC